MKQAGAFCSATAPRGWLKLTAPALWLALATACGFLLASSRRGLDGTDEAAWVLCAADPWQSPGWGILFGFALHPLWNLGLDHLTGFRMAGIGVLLGSAFFFSKAIGRLLTSAPGTEASPFFLWILPTLSVAALARYSIGMRTPSYDWVLLVGGMVFAAGWFWLETANSGKNEVAAMGICSAGLLLAGIGKWTCLPGYFALLVWLVFQKFSRPQRLRCGLLFAAFLAVGFVLFILYATPRGILATMEAGFAQAQTGSHGGLLRHYAVGLLKGAWQVLRALPHVAILYGICWGVLRVLRGKNQPWTNAATATFLAGVLLVLARGHGLGGTTTFSKGMMVTVVWLSGVACLLIPLGRKKHAQGPSMQPSWRRSLVCLLVLPWANGLGTATGITDYLAHGVVFFVAAGCLLLHLAVRRGLPLSCAAAALLAIGIIHATRAASSTFNSYRLGSVWVEMVPVSSGPEKGKLLDYPQNVEALQALDGNLRRLGFQRGDPIVGITDLAGLVYLLGGTSPGCCWYMGFWLQENTGVRAHLSHITPETLARTWILMRGSAKAFEQLDVVWPKDKAVPEPLLLETEYLWPWGDGAGVLQPLKVYRPANVTAP
jgi:hypothetical protein